MDVMQADPSVDVVFGHMTEFVSPDVDEQAAALLREPADDLPGGLRTSCSFAAIRSSGWVFPRPLPVGIGDWYARAMERGLKEFVLPSIVRAQAPCVEQRHPAARCPRSIPPRTQGLARPTATPRRRRRPLGARVGLPNVSASLGAHPILQPVEDGQLALTLPLDRGTKVWNALGHAQLSRATTRRVSGL